MILAKDKYGRIGRKIPGIGFDAKIDVPKKASHQGDVFLSPAALEAEESRHKEREQYEIAMQKAKAARLRAQREAEALIAKKQHFELKAMEQAKKHNPEQEALKKYFGLQMGMSETDKVARSLVTADFSQSGGNPQIVPSGPAYKGVWSADYRKDKIVGNPLSRDGVFGVGVTDYDKIVSGIDVHQWNTVAMQNEKVVGGTIHGVLHDVDKHMARAAMGEDSGFWDWLPSSDDVGEFLSDVGTQISEIADETIDQLRADLPSELKNLATSELRKLIQSGDPRITIPRYSYAQASAIPKWAIYTSVGMMGVGLLLVLYKTFAK